MPERSQEVCQTIGWIINKSESGLYLVVADEKYQQKIAAIYSRGAVGIYDYKCHPGKYSFVELKEWIDKKKDIHTFLIMDFQLAVQGAQDLSGLNFSRDMLSGLGKNLIFVTSSYGDEMLATGAYDFYSFLKIRVVWSPDDMSE